MDLELVKKLIDKDIEKNVSKLKNRAEVLRDELDCLIKKIDEKGVDVWPNSLGEVQNSGRRIDLLCAQLYVLKKHKEMLKRVEEEVDG